MSTAADPWFQTLFADRIGGANYGKGTDIYKFEKIKRAKRKALAEHPERKLLDFGIGENDDMADASVREALTREANKVENRGYADNGIQNYKDAAAEFMQRQFGVTLDPVTEVCHCIGSKPAYAMLPACFINPGDVTLMTAPGYPVAGTWTKYLGGEVVRLPLGALDLLELVNVGALAVVGTTNALGEQGLKPGVGGHEKSLRGVGE